MMMNYPMTLEQYISQNALREIDLVRMGAQIAGVLAVIHQQKKVHGDVRPGNVLVLGDGNYQLIGMEPVRQYPQGNIPAFVAPELQQGAAYSPAIDIYALGMMMRAMEPRKEGVSAVLQEMIQKACEPEPAKRYATALEFANELEMMYEAMAQSYGQAQPMSNSNTNMDSNAQSYGATQPVPNLSINPNVQPYGATQPVQNTNMTPNTNPNSNAQGMQMYGKMPPVLNANTEDKALYRQTQPISKKEHPNTDLQKKEKEASLALRFILPILIVLVVVAAVAAYVVLIRPSLKDKDATTQEVANTVNTTEETTTENTTEGEKTCVVPDMTGLEEASAKSELEALNLTVAVKYDISDTVEEGLVITQSVASGTTVVEETQVVLTVSEGNGCPYEYSQKITVTAASGSTSGTMTLYDWANGDWVPQFSCACVVGKNGIGSNYGEGKGVTPLGTFKLGFVLGTQDPNNGMVFKQASSSTVIVDDVESSLYNTLVDSSQADGLSVDHVGENIVSGKLSCVIFIEHNGNGLTSENVVPGKGSVITICGNNQDISATAGCIDIKASDMASLLTCLDGTKNPYIETSVN